MAETPPPHLVALEQRAREARESGDPDAVGVVAAELEEAGQPLAAGGLLIDAGVELDAVRLVHRGIASCEEAYKTFGGDIAMRRHRGTAAYNAANGWAYLARTYDDVEQCYEAARCEGVWLTLAQLEQESLDTPSEVRLLANIAMSRLREHRLFEALDTAEDAIRLDPVHPMPRVAAAEAAERIVRARSATMGRRDLFRSLAVAREHASRAVSAKAYAEREGYPGAATYHLTVLQRLEAGLSSLASDVDAAVREAWDHDRRHDDWILPEALAFWHRHRIALSDTPFPARCPDVLGDRAGFKRLRQPGHGRTAAELDASFLRFSRALNAAREDFLVARRSFQTALTEDFQVETQFTCFADVDTDDVLGTEPGLLKTALRVALDALDKLGVALNEYWHRDLKGNYYFADVVLGRRAKGSRPPLDAETRARMDANPWVHALVHLTGELFPDKDGTGPALVAFAACARERRNATTHRGLHVTARETGSPDSLTLDRLRAETQLVLRRVKAALLYVCCLVDHDAAIADERSDTPGLTIKSEFRFGTARRNE